MSIMTEHTKSDQTRHKILETGRRLVVKHGFGGVGLARILTESAVPKGSFYYYFASKEAFGEALLQDYVDGYLTRIDALIDGPGTAGAKLNSFWKAWLAHSGTEGIATQCLVVKLGAEVADLSDAMRQILNDGVGQFVQRLAALLRAGAEDGSVRVFEDPEATAQTLYATWLGAAILAKLAQNQTPLERALTETVRTLAPYSTA
jgi:TetR/AcrR family transcriptional regulator, transcriptional repressor for nem operon